MPRRELAGLAVGVAALCFAPEASAWYFPEHVVITNDAIDQQSPELRAILRSAVLRTRDEALPLCANVGSGLDDLSPKTPLRTRSVRAHLGLDCVPFAALPALAADHSNDASELRGVVVGTRGRELVTAAAYEWRRFQEEIALGAKTPLERMSFVHELDVDFYFIDPGYEIRAGLTHAHFVDAGRSIETIVRDAGRVASLDNAVAQLTAHHLRSLELAARGRTSEAILEHAFAVHFLQDAFSSGHLVMNDRLWAHGNDWARRRHDYFDARGLAVTRAMAAEPCVGLERALEADIPPCWTTFGDGYLGIAPDTSDRAHVGRAVKKAQILLAVALDPERVKRMFDALGEREKISFAEYLDPVPWWTVSPAVRRSRLPSVSHAERILSGAMDAVRRLREGNTSIAAVDVTKRPASPLFAEEIAATATNPCTAATPDDDTNDICGSGRALAFGSVGASLLRPLLVDLPVARDDVTKLEGEAAKDHGLAFHLLASAASGALFPPRAPLDFYAPSIGVSLGIAYRFGTYLPGRRDRSAVELNAGVSTALHFDARGEAGGHPQVTMLTQEIRFPIVWELIASYMPPIDLQKVHESGSIILFGGARIHEVITDPTPRLWGVDAEIAAVALSRGRGAHPLYSVSPEIRLHAGFADPSVTQPSLRSVWGPTVSLSFVGGYATFF